MCDRLVYLSNLPRKMSDEEYMKFLVYFHNNEENEQIVGRHNDEVHGNSCSTNHREEDETYI